MFVSRSLSFFFAALVLCATSAWAVPPAVVEAVLAPAWLERDGRTQPLAPGTEIHNGDVLRTGGDARAYMLLAEGSRVKLGESAHLTFYSHSPEPQSFFRGALNIATGAFRFTTALLQRHRDRELTIRVATATVGIRGTDVWGKADKNGELVALIEGKIELSRAGQTIQLTPMSIMEAPFGGPAEVKRLDFGRLNELVPQTEISPGGGAVRADGSWSLVQDGIATQADALSPYDRLRQAGFAARIRPLRTAGAPAEWTYSLRVSGFATAAEASAAATRLQRATGVRLSPRQLAR